MFSLSVFNPYIWLLLKQNQNLVSRSNHILYFRFETKRDKHSHFLFLAVSCPFDKIHFIKSEVISIWIPK